MSRIASCFLTIGEPVRKISRSISRIEPTEVTEARLLSKQKLAGISRVSDITPLDKVGVPVFAAVTPLARDLTTHLGKGISRSAARVSAVMEAIERVSAEQCSSQKRRASFQRLQRANENIIDPEQFDLPPSTTYAANLDFNWVEGWDLVGCQPIWVLEDLVITPPKEGVLDQPDTNGLATGSTYGEAIRHALLEIIERDVIGRHQFVDLYGDEGTQLARPRKVDLASLPNRPKALTEKILSAGLDLVVEDLNSDIDVSVVSSTIIDCSFVTTSGPTVMEFGGWGADPNPINAITRSITEACQSRLGLIQGGRDSYNTIPEALREHTQLARRRTLEPGPMVEASSLSDWGSDSIDCEIEGLVDRLLQDGAEQVIVLDLTRREFGVPTVRVRIPGLSVFAIDRRRIGWRTMRYLL